MYVPTANVAQLKNELRHNFRLFSSKSYCERFVTISTYTRRSVNTTRYACAVCGHSVYLATIWTFCMIPNTTAGI